MVKRLLLLCLLTCAGCQTQPAGGLDKARARIAVASSYCFATIELEKKRALPPVHAPTGGGELLPAPHLPPSRRQPMQQAAELINAVGFPAAIVLILLLFLWRVCRYFAPLGRAVVNEHIDFIKHTKEHQEHQTEALTKQTHLIECLSSTVEKGLQREGDGI